MRLTTRLFITVVFGVLPAFAFAAEFHLTNPTAEFTSITGGSGHTGVGTNQITWGTPASPSGQSGLKFDIFTAPLGPISVGDVFDLGMLTHFNFPTFGGTFADGAGFRIGFTITPPGTVAGPLDFTFGIDETLNLTPCDYPSDEGNPCADKISFLTGFAPQVFDIGGTDYTLQLLGFGSDANNIMRDFISQENGSNSSHLWATITTPSVGVPEPNVLLLMMLGLLALGGTVQLRRKQN